MPKNNKSIREMTRRERRRHSLEMRTFRSIALFSLILGLVCFGMGFIMYMYGLAQDSMDQTADYCDVAAFQVSNSANAAEIAGQVMEIYRQTPYSKADEESYYAAFDELKESADYKFMHSVLKMNRRKSMSDFFFAVPVQEDGVVVFVADTDPREGHEYPAGKQIKIPGFAQKLFFSAGSGEFPRTFFPVPGKGILCVSGSFINGTDASDGCIFAMLRVQSVLKGVRSFAVQFVLLVLLIIFIVGGMLVRKIRRSVVQPINSIAEAANSYTKDRREGAEFTDHFAMLNIHTGDEIENLSLVMADMERDIDSYTENLTAVTAEKTRIGTELGMAAKIQAAMLPHIFPPYPERPEFDLYASMEPAKEVGGDFYDFFLIDEDHLCLVMADVSGKGVPASLFMMVSKVIIQSVAMLGGSARDILEKTNEALCKDNQMDMFVTCWLGILEISTGKMTAVNAGHEYPAIMEPDGKFALFKEPHGFALGGFDDEVYEPYELQLKPGSRIFVYTDGIPEAMDAERDQFGLDRMIVALNATQDKTPEKLLENVRNSVKAFVKDAEQFDDLTMLCLEYKGQ